MVAKKKKNSRSSRDWAKIPQDIRKRVNASIRRAASEVMNDLAERGPRYSGEFIDNWVAIPVDKKNRAISTGSYPYKTRDIPQLATTVKEMKRVMVFEIYNTSSYAMQALDLAPGRFVKKGEPLGGITSGIIRGQRTWGGLRGEVNKNKSGKGVSTAELDWYTNYIRTELSTTLRKNFRFFGV